MVLITELPAQMQVFPYLVAIFPQRNHVLFVKGGDFILLLFFGVARHAVLTQAEIKEVGQTVLAGWDLKEKPKSYKQVNIVIAKTNNKNGAPECIGRNTWVPWSQDIIAKERKQRAGKDGEIQATSLWFV